MDSAKLAKMQQSVRIGMCVHLRICVCDCVYVAITRATGLAMCSYRKMFESVAYWIRSKFAATLQKSSYSVDDC